LAFFLSGCAAAGRPAPLTLPAGDILEDGTALEQGWWRARIRFDWPEDEGPRWFLDLLAADRLFKPALVRHRHTIALWRFHRRAVPDTAGHQFSFRFYSDRDTARRIFHEVEKDPLLAELCAAGLVKEAIFDDLGREPDTDVGATSDPIWSDELQSAWPHYIMGVSAMWLELIHQAADGVSPPSDSMEELLAYYRALDLRVYEIWRDEAQHALLHHLNALFGYRPLIIRKPMQF
jgi:hypothetical protein